MTTSMVTSWSQADEELDGFAASDLALELRVQEVIVSLDLDAELAGELLVYKQVDTLGDLVVNTVGRRPRASGSAASFLAMYG